MEINQDQEVVSRREAEVIRLRYPLEDWIEQLLEKYPVELDSIRPEDRRKRSQRLYKMQRSLKERANRQLF